MTGVCTAWWQCVKTRDGLWRAMCDVTLEEFRAPLRPVSPLPSSHTRARARASTRGAQPPLAACPAPADSRRARVLAALP